jgi:hypothetical protein
MDGEPQYVGVESPKQIYGAWLADMTVVLFAADAFVSTDLLYRTLHSNPFAFVPLLVVLGFVLGMVVNGGVLRGLTGGSVGDHLFRIARVNPMTYRRLGIARASRYSLAPVYELFFHRKPEQSRFRCPATIVARRYLGHNPAETTPAGQTT